MTLPAILQQRDRIDDLFELASNIQNSPHLPAVAATAASARLTEYICVRVAGLIEQSVRQIYYTYAVRRSGASPLSAFVSNSLTRPQNFNGERLCQLARRFDSTWADDLERFLQGARKDAINSVNFNRNRIAHGEWVSVGFVQMREWYEEVADVIDFIEKQVIP